MARGEDDAWSDLDLHVATYYEEVVYCREALDSALGAGRTVGVWIHW